MKFSQSTLGQAVKPYRPYIYQEILRDWVAPQEIERYFVNVPPQFATVPGTNRQVALMDMLVNVSITANFDVQAGDWFKFRLEAKRNGEWETFLSFDTATDVATELYEHDSVSNFIIKAGDVFRVLSSANRVIAGSNVVLTVMSI